MSCHLKNKLGTGKLGTGKLERQCLFLYKVDSLRAGFNLKYVYVLKSLTLFSKKIDCLSLLG